MGVRVLVIVALVGTLAAAGGAGGQSLTPQSPGWERYLTVTWEPFERRGIPYLGGYVVNTYGAMASRVQLLVDNLDSSGRIVGQQVEWLGGAVPAFSRTYFEVPVRQPAVSYRVRVFAFDFLQAARIESP